MAAGLKWAVIVFSSLVPLFAASISHQLFVQVRPEVMLIRQSNDMLLLKIRLAPGARAAVWNAETCGSPDPAAYSVVSSGIYSIPLSAIPGPADAGTCLASTDGALRSFVPTR